jgi:two-component system, NarL family, sensor histidine kinase DegS
MILSKGKQEKVEPDELQNLQEELHSELENVRHELNDISLMLEQSQLEVNKLAQRNTSITAQVQQIQSQFDKLPRAEIRMAYDSALEAQQRLFVMRGQLEKLQSDRMHLDRYVSTMEKVISVIESSHLLKNRGKSATAAAETVELLVKAQEAERQRLARQMHDEPAQALSNFIMQTEIAMRLFDLDQDKARAELDSLKETAKSTFQKVRDFIFDLRPMMLDDLGLAPTLKRYAEAYKDQSGVEVRLVISGMEQRLESYLEVMIFRAVQELVGNAVKHSQATQIKVQINADDHEVRVVVEDDGKGFDVEAALEKGMGIKFIRDRIDMLGGLMEVDSVVGQGTRLDFQIPTGQTKVFA